MSHHWFVSQDWYYYFFGFDFKICLHARSVTRGTFKKGTRGPIYSGVVVVAAKFSL